MLALRRSTRWNIPSLRPRLECDYLIPDRPINEAGDNWWQRVIYVLIGLSLAVMALV